MNELACDILIVGGGTGGTAAALALADKGLKVVLTEPTDWIGGQLTSQAVPPDEHPWIEQCGCTRRYRHFREMVRATYRRDENLTDEARRNFRLNPGGGWVSHLCHSPAVGHRVLQEMLKPALHSGLTLLLHHQPVSASVDGDEIKSVTLRNTESDSDITVWAKFFLDATETGELLPLTGTEYRLGAESKSQTNEPNALDGDPEPENVQGITWCAALGWDPEGDHTIEKPAEYDFWKDFQPVGWPDKLLSFTMLHVQKGEPVHFPLFSEDWFNLFSYRQIVQPAHHKDAREAATIMNWPMNDYYIGTILDVDAEVAAKRLKSSKQLTLSMLYWLQTEHGYRGLRLRGDLTGTSDGLAKAAYIRESRRIEARFTVLEQHIAAYTNSEATLAPEMPASVGVGAYRIDLHPSTNERPTLDTSTLPFQIPLGALIPVRIRNLIPACKNIGVTHITNGCYRLHPIEWNIGEVAGLLAWHCLEKKLETSQVLANAENVIDFQSLCHSEGIEIAWPKFRAL